MYTQTMENKDNRWWDALAFVLLLLALWAAVFRLEATHWTSNLGRMEVLVTLGYILGALLGLSVFERKTVYWVAAAFTMFFVTWQVVSIVNPALDWPIRLTQALQRVGISINDFFRNKPNTDIILFVTLMGMLFWFIGLTAGYMLTRNGRPWVPLMAAGVTLFIVDFNNAFLHGRYTYSGVFVLLSLLLLGRLYYLRSQKEWIEKGVSVDFETGFSLGRSMIISGLIIVLLAWNLPSVLEALTPGTKANNEFSSTFTGFKDRISNAVRGLNNPVVYVNSGFSSSMALGNGTVLGEDTLFTVKVSAPPNDIRYYWRGYSYDNFDGKDWKNTIDTQEQIALDQWPLKVPQYQGRTRVDLLYSLQGGATRVAYVPSELLSLDKAANLYVEKGDNGDYDVISALSNTPLQSGVSLKASALVPSPTVIQLEEAGQNYPAWVKEHYLQLPQNFSAKVRAAAVDITAGKVTPYDKALAITQYLRKNITYEKVIPNPPAGVDTMEWFLFDYKKGFCNYYATAEVLMLRSVGIPARIAIGYAQGQYDDVNHEFTVRAGDSHAWPEVYFPDAGWVEFEPTAAQPALDLPQGVASTNGGGTVQPTPYPIQGGLNPSDNNRLNNVENIDVPNQAAPAPDYWSFVIPILVLVLAGLIYLWLRKHPDWLRKPFPHMLEETIRKRGMEVPGILSFWSRQLRLSPMERMFERVSWMLWLLGHDVVNGETPAEQMAELVRLAPEAAKPAGVLLDEYQRAEYSQHLYDRTLAREAYVNVWRLVISSLSRRLLKASPG